ncbi:unnamed protein product [Ambrosiozyma monospora]|uniref:Unnamed protein product n=1 Tax=Ambrosiozyma monospora TaxID=43982 RepID=A0A9W7DLH9_AMBMO|nr:unnamed protein product [Ambrosiozyma monospora]
MFVRLGSVGLKKVPIRSSTLRTTTTSLNQTQFYSAIARRSRFGKKLTPKKDETPSSESLKDKDTVLASKEEVTPNEKKEAETFKANLYSGSQPKAPIKNDSKPGISKRSSKQEKSKNVTETDSKNDTPTKESKDASETTSAQQQETQPKGEVKHKKHEKRHKEQKTRQNAQNKGEKDDSDNAQVRVRSKPKKKLTTEPSSHKPKLDIPKFLSVSNFATILRVRVPSLLIKLKELGFENMTNDYILDAETAALIAEEYGFQVNQDDNLGLDLFPSEDSTDLKKIFNC